MREIRESPFTLSELENFCNKNNYKLTLTNIDHEVKELSKTYFPDTEYINTIALIFSWDELVLIGYSEDYIPDPTSIFHVFEIVGGEND